MLAAIGWGSLAASSLVLGELLTFARRWPIQWVGFVLAFGSGALISAISFDLAAEGERAGGLGVTAIGLAVGALTFYVLDGVLAKRTSTGRGRPGRAAAGAAAGPALALGAFLDGVPEQMALGIGLAAGQGVSVGLLVAIFVSNLPEAIGGATDMKREMHSDRRVLLSWLLIAVLCVFATLVGYGIADIASDELQAGINGFAAGALIVMLVDSMIPEATEQAGRTTGLVTTLGFAVAAGLSFST
jgi:ZIP family zinc transporter